MLWNYFICNVICYLPFEGENNDELFQNILICRPELPDFLTEKGKKLIIKILNPNPY